MKLFTVIGDRSANSSNSISPLLVRMTAEYLAIGSILTGGALEYWVIRTPPTSTNPLTGSELAVGLETEVDGGGDVELEPAADGGGDVELEPAADGGGNVGATTEVGGATVGAGLGVCNTQATRLMAVREDAMRNFSFMLKG